jgi:hypothetical protein
MATHVLNTLSDIPHKWYNIEEVSGHTFDWNVIKSNFVKDFEFISEEALLQATTKEIKIFLEKSSPKRKKGKIKPKEKLSKIKENNVTNKLVTIIRYKETVRQVQDIQSM